MTALCFPRPAGTYKSATPVPPLPSGYVISRLSGIEVTHSAGLMGTVGSTCATKPRARLVALTCGVQDRTKAVKMTEETITHALTKRGDLVASDKIDFMILRVLFLPKY